MLLTMSAAGATMKIPDLLSPKDVMIDVPGFEQTAAVAGIRCHGRRPPRPARRSGGALPFEAGRSRIDRDRQRRSHPARAAAGSEAALRSARETEGAGRIRCYRRAGGGHRICAAAARGRGERAARAGGPDLETTGESRPIASRENCCRALCGDHLTAGTRGAGCVISSITVDSSSWPVVRVSLPHPVLP